MLTESQREAQRRYREKNREALNAKARIRNAKRTKEQKSEDNRKWRERHPDEHKRRNAEWRAANSVRHRANARRWQIENPERFRENQQRWKAANREYSREYYHSTEHRKTVIKLRTALRNALFGRGLSGEWRVDTLIGLLVGCRKPELIAHIERQFTTGMSWDNYGKGGWEIDHVIPCNAFDLTDPAQQRACFHYTNLRPLWRADNLRRAKKEVDHGGL